MTGPPDYCPSEPRNLPVAHNKQEYHQDRFPLGEGQWSIRKQRATGHCAREVRVQKEHHRAGGLTEDVTGVYRE